MHVYSDNNGSFSHENRPHLSCYLYIIIPLSCFFMNFELPQEL